MYIFIDLLYKLEKCLNTMNLLYNFPLNNDVGGKIKFQFHTFLLVKN